MNYFCWITCMVYTISTVFKSWAIFATISTVCCLVIINALFFLSYIYSLYAFRHLESFQILVCGGDGTVGWVLSSLDECSKDLTCHDPPVAIVPLGTGKTKINTVKCLLMDTP